MAKFIHVMCGGDSPALVNLDHVKVIRVQCDDDATSVIARASDADHYYTLAEFAPTMEGVFKAKHYIAELGKLWQRTGDCADEVNAHFLAILDDTELHEGRLVSTPCPDCGSRQGNDNCAACFERITVR